MPSYIGGGVMRNRVYATLLVIFLHCASLAQALQQDSLVIKGQVLDDQGHPVSGAVITAAPDAGLRGRVPSAASNARGEFTIPVYRTGGFLVTASKLADAYPSSSNPFYYPMETSLARVFVGEDRAAPFATIRLGHKAGKIAGSIVDAKTGQAILDAQITLCRAEVPKYCYRPFVKYPGGKFNIFVPPAPFTIRISATGYRDWYGTEGEDRQPAPLHVASGTTKMVSASLERLPALGEDIVNPSSLKAPQTLLPVDGAEFVHYPRTTRLEWSAVDGAASYTVELEVCQPAKANEKECEQTGLLQIRGNPPLSGIAGTSYEFLFVGTQPGRWRVWAVDAKGRVGAKSAWSMFFYRFYK
jgi:hypothetical protein